MMGVILMKSKAIKFLNSIINDDTTKAELDVIDFLKKLVRDYKVPEKKQDVDWLPMFETLWKLYPRKIGKQNAIKQFEHKVRGLSEQECKDKCNLIYKAEMRYVQQVKQNETPMEYIRHFSTFLNAEVPNSKFYKGR